MVPAVLPAQRASQVLLKTTVRVTLLGYVLSTFKTEHWHPPLTHSDSHGPKLLASQPSVWVLEGFL